MFQICFGLYLGEILAQRPHVGGGIFHTEFIQICTIFGVDFDKKQHIHQILQFSKPDLLVQNVYWHTKKSRCCTISRFQSALFTELFTTTSCHGLYKDDCVEVSHPSKVSWFHKNFIFFTPSGSLSYHLNSFHTQMSCFHTLCRIFIPIGINKKVW